LTSLSQLQPLRLKSGEKGFRRVEHLLVDDVRERPPQARLEPRRGLCGDLQPVLEDLLWKVVAGHGCEDETEAIVGRRRLVLEGAHDVLQLGHPGLKEVAILKEDPVALLPALLDQLRGNLLLTLPKGLLEEPVPEPLLPRVIEDLLVRVCALTQDKDDGRGLVGHGEDGLDAARRGLGELF